MKNKKLLKYFTDQILPILDEIDFNDTNHEEYIKAQETLNQVLNKYKLKFNSHTITLMKMNNIVQDVNDITLEVPKNNNTSVQIGLEMAA